MANLQSNQTYYDQKITKVEVTDISLTTSEFEQCEFTFCSFTQATFDQCKFIDCTFSECTISAVQFMNCMLRNITFRQSKVLGIDWTLARTLVDIQFANSQLNYSNFRFLPLQNIQISECMAKEVDFTEADMTGGNFEQTDFEGSKFFKTNLTNANFRHAKNYLINVQANTVKKAIFSFPEAVTLLTSFDIVVEY